jgi:Arc/MetJ-type ribon-helix-helix transcriptional regulator
MTVPQELVSAIPQKISHKFQRAVDPAKDFRKFQIFTALFRFQKPTHHREPKTPVVEHKGNASHLTADEALRAVSLTTFSVQRFNPFCCTLCNGDPGVTYGPSPHLQSEGPMAMVRKQKAVTHGLRYNAELNNRIEAATKKGGFSSHSAFIRAAIERELAGRESGVDAAEQRIAASLDRMAREIRNLRMGQQALFAFVDVLAKTFLTCVPEPPRDVQEEPARTFGLQNRDGAGNERTS